MARDACRARARRAGHDRRPAARPVQVAITSALTFAVGAALPLGLLLVSPGGRLVPVLGGGSLLCLGLLGALAARAGGARTLVGAARVVFWGALAMGLTAAIGALFGATPA